MCPSIVTSPTSSIATVTCERTRAQTGVELGVVLGVEQQWLKDHLPGNVKETSGSVQVLMTTSEQPYTQQRGFIPLAIETPQPRRMVRSYAVHLIGVPLIIGVIGAGVILLLGWVVDVDFGLLPPIIAAACAAAAGTYYALLKFAELSSYVQMPEARSTAITGHAQPAGDIPRPTS
jgi:hypothetical protein